MFRTTMRPGRRAALGASAALALTLTACSQGSATAPQAPAGDGDRPVTITYMNFSANGGHEGDLDAIVTAFEEANPDIDVQVETLPYADYFTKLLTSVAGGTVSDTFELNYENFVTYAANGALAELTIENADAYTPSLLESFSHDGAQLGLPASFSNVVLFYNTDLFDAAGLEHPTADWTWADEQAAAEKLTDRSAGVWGDYQPISFHEFYKALAQAGGEFFDAEQTAATFASPEGIEAATWLVGKSGTTMPTEADGAGTADFDTDLFKAGKLGMWHSGIWMFGGLAEVEGLGWDIAVEPGSAEKASALFANGVVVSAKSAHPEEATRWLEFLTASSTTVETRLATSWELPPVADQSMLDSYLEVTPPANRAAVFDSLDAVVLPPVIESQQEMQDIVGEELANAAAGRKTVEQALTDAQTRVTALLG
ncbi:ABC transporter substrate-binding protein [Cellulomonas chengniuliangii]|uniref:Sugar ABC transporter substrate-binding protein n=1 Tax=Cellulomonas chengniuliangii TaxID=2968084 RepID=A0ABY5KVU4_9CELL|nr:sugar ABC transporter substrate-binding protein [Cellulomonas chengniuliangii]MCC2309956.1 sugar ABC transporter substrate-binding protein [Cellulomonas chengniuliangii]MCC2317068.1 sugar ABC transporter substrate-binding protein [Cellulomonas chengniuliangii]UUI74641.1 sugar ABC transporter substrate-binding protein [Cellulomonas chengniuliangii]